MTREEFDLLSEKEQRELVVSALSWLCVYEAMRFIPSQFLSHIEVIKIVLGKFKDK